MLYGSRNALWITGFIIDSVHFLTEKSSHFISWEQAAQSIKFLSNEAKYTLFLSYYFSSSPVKIGVCPGDELQTFYSFKVDG